MFEHQNQNANDFATWKTIWPQNLIWEWPSYPKTSSCCWFKLQNFDSMWKLIFCFLLPPSRTTSFHHFFGVADKFQAPNLQLQVRPWFLSFSTRFPHLEHQTRMRLAWKFWGAARTKNEQKKLLYSNFPHLKNLPWAQKPGPPKVEVVQIRLVQFPGKS